MTKTSEAGLTVTYPYVNKKEPRIQCNECGGWERGTKAIRHAKYCDSRPQPPDVIDDNITDHGLKIVKWRKIPEPTSWRPKKGDELIGWYIARTKKNGKFGEYTVITVLVPYKGSVLVSGTMVVQLADSAMLRPGDPVKIVYLGKKDIGNDRKMKTFELFIGDGHALTEQEIPEHYRS